MFSFIFKPLYIPQLFSSNTSRRVHKTGYKLFRGTFMQSAIRIYKQTKMLLLHSAFLLILLLCTSPFAQYAKQRAIILTDISPSEQEPDDIESMVRLMLYSNDLDIEGLIATSSCWRSKDPLRPDLISDIVNTYGKVRSNLITHSSGYPEAKKLLDVIKEGNAHGIAAVGNGKSSPGSNLIIQAVTNSDQRPLWICIWGGAATLAQSLFDAKNTLSTPELTLFLNKLCVYDLSGQDDAGAWICHTFPNIFYIRSQFQWRGFSTRLDGLWPESVGGDEFSVNSNWFNENIIKNHGPLGASYPHAKYLYEGDTPTFLNLINNGLTDPQMVEYGGWGGRFSNIKLPQVRTGSTNTTVKESSYDPYQMFTDASDIWKYTTKEYNNIYCSIFRWRSACQNDFAARMDWCSSSYSDANHSPIAIVNKDTSKKVLYYWADPGSNITLSGSGSTDPDNNILQYNWWVYPEAGSYKGSIKLSTTTAESTLVTIPSDCGGKTFHIIVTLTDNGSPPLSSFRRIVITGNDNTSTGSVLPFKYRAHKCDESISKSDVSLYLLSGRQIMKRQTHLPGIKLHLKKTIQSKAAGEYISNVR